MKKLHRNILKSLVLVGALALSGTAMASTFNVGELTIFNQSVTWPIGPQSDTYNFTIPVLSNNAEAVASVNFDLGTLGTYHISELSLGVYDSDDNLLSGAGLSFTGTLTPGSYHAIVSGTADGTLGGTYAIAMAANAAPNSVPAPNAALLLGCGLVGLMGLNRRKK